MEALPAAVFPEDQSDRGQFDTGTFAERFEVFDFDGFEHFPDLSFPVCRCIRC
jgi:hypothetical protein